MHLNAMCGKEFIFATGEAVFTYEYKKARLPVKEPRSGQAG